jgi:hypothetical protein
MEEKQLNNWIEKFHNGINSIKVSFDAFFISKPIDSYYNLRVDKEHNNLILEIIDEDELPTEISRAIMDAYIKAKPVI